MPTAEDWVVRAAVAPTTRRRVSTRGPTWRRRVPEDRAARRAALPLAEVAAPRPEAFRRRRQGRATSRRPYLRVQTREDAPSPDRPHPDPEALGSSCCSVWCGRDGEVAARSADVFSTRSLRNFVPETVDSLRRP